MRSDELVGVLAGRGHGHGRLPVPGQPPRRRQRVRKPSMRGTVGPSGGAARRALWAGLAVQQGSNLITASQAYPPRIDAQSVWWNLQVANDSLETLAERMFVVLARLQDERGDGTHHSYLPKIAASHFAAHFVTAGWANRCGLHAVSLGTARQTFEALSVIELGFLEARGLAQLHRWNDGAVTAGGLRKWLETEVWPTYPSGLAGHSWTEFMTSMGKALQPYAHFSPSLMQWNMNVVVPPSRGSGAIVAIGSSSYDRSRAARIQLLRGALLWALGTVIQLGDVSSVPLDLRKELDQLRAEAENSEWMGGADWSDRLIPHVWDEDDRT